MIPSVLPEVFTIAAASEQMRTGKLSPVELTEQCLARIERFNPRLNAFITVTADLAREQARTAEREIRDGKWRGPLHGLPIALKDIVDTAGIRTTAASALFADRVPERDADVAARLRRAGAVLMGKTNLHEFAYGASGVIGHFGVTRNPWNPSHTCGGSSSGSAAAVAAGMCCGAIGTDTACSIRLPASECGITGFKPTFNSVSAQGVIPLAWSYDHVGPMTRTAEDAALMLEVIAETGQAPSLQRDIRSLRLGLPCEYFFDGLDPEIKTAVDSAMRLLEGLAAGLREISFPVDEDRAVASRESWDYHAEFVARSPQLYDRETLRRIRTGERVTDEAFAQKKGELESLRKNAAQLFADCQVDLLLTPATPIPPPLIDDLRRDPQALRPTELLMMRNMRPFNVLGAPAISVPCGFTRQGLPIGLQIAGPPGADAVVISLAYAYQQQTDWHLRAPALM
jgi:aspartyl-tRNA(Asn)/glutamyl-tRNA(Gln) amidotransferase subunit A